MTPATDLDLVKSFQQGNVGAFNELVRRYQQKVYWIARRVVKTHEDADDVVQDVFIKAYDGLKEFRSESGFYTWLYRITVNVALNAVRSRKLKSFFGTEDTAEEPVDTGARPDEQLERSEYDALLKKAIDRLPPKQKLVFTMRYIDQMSYDEMAVTLRKSVGGLKANYFHALKKIQEYMQQEIRQ